MGVIVHHGSRHRQTGAWLAGLALFGSLVACSGGAGSGEGLLADEAVQRGLVFTATYGAKGGMYFHEVVGTGVGLLDYDRDGDLDVYLVQGLRATAQDRLFRNDAGADGPRFVDVTERCGLAAAGLGMAVSVGDVDDDGWPDLYLANLGPNQLWRNTGGRFEEVMADLGPQDERWSTGATFVDVDGDGRQDLYVLNYTDYRIVNNVGCRTHDGELDYCGPESYTPLSDSLFLNRGSDGFEDATLAAGLVSRPGAGLGVAAADLSGDGVADIYVANDGMRNVLWSNLGGGRLADTALESGVAVNRYGEPEASMGVALGDVDRDGDEDLFLTHLLTETNTLYRNLGGGMFDEPTVEVGLGASSVGSTGFGTILADLDGSGWLDLFVANGGVRLLPERSDLTIEQRLAQRNQLFLGADGRFTEVTQREPVLARESVSRGVAAGDVDNDGRPDIVVDNMDSPSELLMNHSADVAWVGFSLARESGGAAVGSAVRSPLFGRRQARRDGSYMSSSDPRVLFRGPELGGEWRIDWAQGGSRVFAALPRDHYFRISRTGARSR